MREQVELELTGMAHGGTAVGKAPDGRVVFVLDGISGEQVNVRIVKDKRKFATAEILEIEAPSQFRVEPPCPYFGRCGGCQWQHIAYAAQLEFKRQIVQDQMTRVGRFRHIDVLPTIASPSAWHYRSHSTFHATPDHRPGFVERDHRTVLPIDECLIAQPQIIELAKTIKDISSSERLRVQIGSEGEAFAFEIEGEDSEATTSVPSASESAAVYYSVKGKRFRCSAGSFFQVNVAQAATLVDLVLSYVEPYSTGEILELYSGVGLFTAFLAEHAKSISAIEFSESAVRDAEVNLQEFDHITLYQRKVERVLRPIKKKFDVVVLDPPRSGVNPAALTAFLSYEPKRIVYVSCDPATLARDARLICEKGYRIVAVQPVDMFPQTYHIECVMAFEKIT